MPTTHRRILSARTWGDRECARQAAWLQDNGVTLAENNRTSTVDGNAPFLSDLGRAEIALGGGSELRAKEGLRPKLCSPWSSTALVANVFDYWRGRDLAPLGVALDLGREVASLRLEAKLPTGFRRAEANLDVIVEARDGRLTAIESKFLEPFGSAPGGTAKNDIASVYLDSARIPEWKGLRSLRELAARVASGADVYRRLDVPQLIKHALALTKHGRAFELVLLWYSPPEHLGETQQMEREIASFAEVARRDALPFRAITHQHLFARLAVDTSEHATYLAYLRSRYFPPIAAP